MNQIDVISLLKTIDDLNLYYDHAPNGTKVPFSVVTVNQPDNVFADNTVYVENWHYRLLLYCAVKDPQLEKKVKDLLNTAELPWSRSEIWLDDQNCYEIEFEFDSYGNIPDPVEVGDADG